MKCYIFQGLETFPLSSSDDDSEDSGWEEIIATKDSGSSLKKERQPGVIETYLYILFLKRLCLPPDNCFKMLLF